MEFNELIFDRRSVRHYSAPAPHEIIEEILRQAMRAPSWKNGQPWKCYVVETLEMRETLRQRALWDFNRKNSENAVLIVSAYEKGISGFSDGVPDNEVGNGWGAYDLGLHDAFLILAARNMGYDSLIMGIRDAEALREILAIPETEEILSVIAVGKRAKEPGMRPRKGLEEVVHYL